MQHRPLLSFTCGTTLVEDSEHRFKLESPRGAIRLGPLTPGLCHALQSLIRGGATAEELAGQVIQADGVSALGLFYYYLGQVRSLGLLGYTVSAENGPLVTLEPISPGFRPDAPAISTEQSFLLSRFAYCRRLGSALVIDSPLACARTTLHGSVGAALAGELTQPRTGRELAASLNGVDEEIALQALRLLASAALITEARANGSSAEDEDDVLTQWEFHDLLFHSRSRPGRHHAPAGATYRFLGRIPPRPAVRPRISDDVILLFRPDLDRLLEDDLPLTHVIEQRISVRDQGERPITAEQVGEFLYRTARVRSVTEPGPRSPKPYAVSSRPYPGGGAAYELEIYLIVEACDGIAPGLYHYEAAEHGLSRISGTTAKTEALLRNAAQASGMGRNPQILITLAARFQRLSWKYETIAYAAVLKNVGVYYQTMYLVATAMGLAPCALGSGNSEIFAEATGLPYLEESSVGEFMLGSRRR